MLLKFVTTQKSASKLIVNDPWQVVLQLLNFALQVYALIATRIAHHSMLASLKENDPVFQLKKKKKRCNC